MENTQPDPVSRADAALERVVAIQAQIDALTASRTEAIREFEEVFAVAYPPESGRFLERAARAELACALRVPERTAERLMGEARVLVEQLPATLAALGQGLFSYRHAQLLVGELSGLSAADMAAVERVALGSAGTQTASRFARTVRRLRERRDPSTMIERVKAAHDTRTVTLEPAPDGMAYLTAYLGAVDAEAIFERLTDAAHRTVADGDPRPLTQVRVDILTDALLGRDRGKGAFHGIVPTVLVTVPALTLLGRDEPATLDGIGPIDAATARRITAEAKGLYRLLTHPETGVALSLGRTRYQIPTPLRIWLRIRDGSCRFPGCTISTRHSDIDHTRAWDDGGATDHDNLAHLSRGHHTLKHHGGWSVRQEAGGRLRWTSFLGREYTTEPEWAADPDR
ncbi:HNH endonuclease signature motif containing protein [Protaetiibacter larvae]|uniref:DUF222 domain-containing protein n=1 Tax=Protaetiibacter larvae TaxID=2592654 RepID=A0A5C1Y9H2_9MICO|nr:HNH endonuclease signature motif containing protein [Protaetiibacter larvae]QEO10048.1 DUF222 domain-containing protein [Protaetiibacter larvae]